MEIWLITISFFIHAAIAQWALRNLKKSAGNRIIFICLLGGISCLLAVLLRLEYVIL